MWGICTGLEPIPSINLGQQQDLVNKLEKAKLNCLTTVLRFGSEQGYLEEIPYFCFITLLPNILKHIGMGENNYLIIGKKQPRTLKIETIESVGAQLLTVLAIHDRDLWHLVLCGPVEQLQAEQPKPDVLTNTFSKLAYGRAWCFLGYPSYPWLHPCEDSISSGCQSC